MILDESYENKDPEYYEEDFIDNDIFNERGQYSNFRPWGMELKQFTVFMHLSQFLSFVFPFAGIVMPIVMWATNKDQSELIDRHGKNILNWIISSTIYIIASLILMFLIVGIFTLIAVVICSFVFTIIGAIRANEGEVYEYPLAIKIIR